MSFRRYENFPLSYVKPRPSVRIAYISDSYINIHIVDDNFSVYLCTMDILGSIQFCCFTESVSYFFLCPVVSQSWISDQ